MYEGLRTHILNRVHLSGEELDLALTFFIPRKIRKRQIFLQAGEICRQIAFVSKGCLRCYSVDDEGSECVVQFAIEDWWISDLQSFITNTPATFNIDALEDSELLLLTRESREKLFDAVPGCERLFRILLEHNYSFARSRISELIGTSAEDRYLHFMKTYPEVVQRVPQSQIASYLGITPQSLSRIRKDLPARG